MFSPRRMAQFGLISSSLVLVISLGVLVSQGGDKSSTAAQGNSAGQGAATAVPVSLSAGIPVDRHAAPDHRP